MSSLVNTIADFGQNSVRLAGEVRSLEARQEDISDRCSHNKARVLEFQEELSCKAEQLTEAETVIADLKRQLYGPTFEILGEEDQEEVDGPTDPEQEKDSQECSCPMRPLRRKRPTGDDKSVTPKDGVAKNVASAVIRSVSEPSTPIAGVAKRPANRWVRK